MKTKQNIISWIFYLHGISIPQQGDYDSETFIAREEERDGGGGEKERENERVRESESERRRGRKKYGREQRGNQGSGESAPSIDLKQNRHVK